MRYRLGQFRPRPAFSDQLQLWMRQTQGGTWSGALEKRLRMDSLRSWDRRKRDSDVALTDLLQVLEPTHPDHGWVPAAHDRLRRIERGGVQIRLLACHYEAGPDGLLTLVATAPELTLEVLPGDGVQIGFAARRVGSDPVRVWPRLMRQVCANGTLVCLSEFEAHVGAAGVEEAIQRCFSPARYESVLQELREMRRTLVENPLAYLGELRDIHGRQAPYLLHGERIERQFWSDGDDSLYGLLNAVTATARNIPDWRERLDLEEFAGRLVGPPRPVPSRSGGGVLIPA